jgi:hypothetical protein
MLPTGNLLDLVPTLTDADFGIARGPDAGRPACSCHAWSKVTVEDCAGEPTAFRCCLTCGQLEDCNLVVLSEMILADLSGVI